MSLEPIYNCWIDSFGTLHCDQGAGVQISNLIIDFGIEVIGFEKDHCECIKSSVTVKGSRLFITLVTEKNDIDEYVVFTAFSRNGKPQNLKFRFVR